MKTVKSYGVACCRKNPYCVNGQYEILFIKKRITYSFIEFVNGTYQQKNLFNLINSMSTNEKILILTFNFKLIWYHCNMSCSNNKRYIKAKNKFDNLYKSDDGFKLKDMINESTNEELIWEIPKGRCKKNELPINAAIREFEEETNIDKLKYKVLYDKEPIVFSFCDNNINYVYYYFIGIMLDNYYEPKINYFVNNMVFEISDIKFVNTNLIKSLNKNISFHNMIKKIIKIVKNTKY